MKNAFDYLEALAVSGDAAPAAVPAGIPGQVREAIEARDPAALARALGGRAFMACSIMAPDRDEPQREDAPYVPEDAPDEREPDAA